MASINMIKRPKTRSSSSSIHRILPSEIMFDILSRLPVPSISRSRFVCKDWNAIIKDEAFIDMHHSRVSKQNPAGFLLLCHTNASMETNLYSLSHDDDVAVKTCYHLTPKKPAKEILLVGAANGLACLSSVPSGARLHMEADLESFYICNPLTREVLKLPEAMKHQEAIDFYNSAYHSPSGFAYDATSNTYKVFHALPQPAGTNTTVVEIFALGSKTWKRIPDVPTSLFRKTPVLCHGALHWKTSNRGIGAIDVGAETFRALKTPPPPLCSTDSLCLLEAGLPFFCVADEYEYSLCTLGDDLLSVAYEYQDWSQREIEIWSMKEYGAEDSWSKQYVTDTQMLGPLKGMRFQILTTPKDGTLLLLGRKDQGYYDLESKEFRQIQIQGISKRLNSWNEDLYAFVHLGSSLISPKRIAAKIQRQSKMKKQQQQKQQQRKKKQVATQQHS